MGLKLCGLQLRRGPFPGPLPPFLSPQGSACGILTFPGTGCNLCFGAREGGDLGGGNGRFSGQVPGTQSPLWAWAEERVCFAYWEDREDLWKGWCASSEGALWTRGMRENGAGTETGAGEAETESETTRVAGWEGRDREGEEGSAARSRREHRRDGGSQGRSEGPRESSRCSGQRVRVWAGSRRAGIRSLCGLYHRRPGLAHSHPARAPVSGGRPRPVWGQINQHRGTVSPRSLKDCL